MRDTIFAGYNATYYITIERLRGRVERVVTVAAAPKLHVVRAKSSARRRVGPFADHDYRVRFIRPSVNPALCPHRERSHVDALHPTRIIILRKRCDTRSLGLRRRRVIIVYDYRY